MFLALFCFCLVFVCLSLAFLKTWILLKSDSQHSRELLKYIENFYTGLYLDIFVPISFESDVAEAAIGLFKLIQTIV